jgi:Uma2 family endonuclease
MPLLIDDPKLEKRLLRRRRLMGGDRYDEVWDGVYVMSPLANEEHQQLVTDFSIVFGIVIKFAGLGEVRAGVNLSDREKGWKKNYRIPDVAVKLNGGLAKILKNHWAGGPDFVVEIASTRDRTREKLDFYSAIGTREVLVVDREPWGLELFARRGDQLVSVGVSHAGSPIALFSEVLPLTFRLVDGEPVPKIEITHPETGRSWMI